ncbi:glutaredoxin [Trypanosoma rangeli SC58]|uniref:Glutaredoxin n=1 Tax=Trypanosoma rangeli SC58 TaxID=429131 RepID=A0A061IT19_TRYRA|nr:glutaredoxin [Trypanosoma rangeli SC58]
MSQLSSMLGTHKAVMFSWVSCPYCVRAEKLLRPMTNDFKIYHVDQMSEGEALRKEIYEKYQHETVPAIFINGKFVGGCSDVEQLDCEGRLAPLLA